MHAPALSLAGWDVVGGVREQLALVAAWGFRAVALDGKAPGLRAREIDRSGRRDLAAALRRAELACVGIDLWIPAEHFAEVTHADRALAAARGAIELAADLARLTDGVALLSLCLPSGVRDVRDALAAAADPGDVVVADHQHPPAPGEPGDPMAVGIDPATVLFAGGDPVSALLAAGDRLAVARLSDCTTAGRCEVGAPGGRLDVAGYAPGVGLSSRSPMVVVDARQVQSAERAARAALDVWNRLAPGRG